MGIGTPVALLVGMLLVLGAVGLFFFDKIRPAYARDADKVYAAFIMLAGLVTLVNWGMEAGPSFLMFVMSGMLTTLIIENIRNREPKVAETLPPYDKRPQRPRYNERPPVQRGYRAEIDRDAYRDRPPADLPLRRQPRMNPAQEAAWSDGYSDDSRARQPYEEYRGPAGRLQPSRQPNPQSNPQSNFQPNPQSNPQSNPQPNPQPNRSGPPDNRYSDNERYGQRPPAQRLDQRPPNQRPPEQRPAGQGMDQRPPENNDYPQRPPQGGPSRNVDQPEGLSPANGRPKERPPRLEERSGERPPRPEAPRDRSLNIRPLSEAPQFDDDYGPNTPEGAPS